MDVSGEGRKGSANSRARPEPALSEAEGGAPQTRDQTGWEAHESLISFLESPASYPHRPAEVHVVQIHISWVFIASPFVFKVTKSVNLGFLDFSTLEKRRHFCQREVELNRRLCPEIYLDVVPIYKTGSGFSFQEQGEIAEYAAKIRELRSGLNSVGFAIATAICTSITFILLGTRPPSSIASNSTIDSVSSTLQTISPFWRWILILRVEAIWRIYFSGMRRANFATRAC